MLGLNIKKSVYETPRCCTNDIHNIIRLSKIQGSKIMENLPLCHRNTSKPVWDNVSHMRVRHKQGQLAQPGHSVWSRANAIRAPTKRRETNHWPYSEEEMTEKLSKTLLDGTFLDNRYVIVFNGLRKQKTSCQLTVKAQIYLLS